MAKNEEKLKEIRDRFDYCVLEWQSIRDEGDLNARFAAGDPWEPAERAQRKALGRKCLAFDELNQYINQSINDVRMNKQSIKVTPQGEGTNDKKAELIAAIIRRIEVKSHAVAARTSAFEACVTRNLGFYKVSSRYVNDTSFDQELAILPIRNPNCVYVDPDYKQPDMSDIQYAFIVDIVPRSEYKRRFPNAEVSDFTTELMKTAPRWVNDQQVQIAEYWYIEKKKEKLVIEGQSREVERKRVYQCITNGLEILEENTWGGEITKSDGTKEWRGKWIPIIAIPAKEVFVDNGMGETRRMLSLISLAREPYMAYCYARTSQAELTGLMPKAPAVGYKGQFEGLEDSWDNAHKIPVSRLEVNPVLDATGTAVLPLPKFAQFDPAPIQVLDGTAESWRRAIQAAIGTSALPTAAQRRNEKSGVALQRIEESQQRGSFHLKDNYERAMEHEARVILDVLPYYYDTEREVGIVRPDESFATEKINQVGQDEMGQEIQTILADGEHDVTVSTGPTFQSQREEANAFVETLVANLATLPVPPEMKAKLLALAIKMRDLGALGDEMADILSPSQEEMSPEKMMMMMHKMKQEIDALNAYAKQMEQEKAQLQATIDSKVMDIESKERIAAQNNQTKMLVEEFKVYGDLLMSKMEAQFREIDSRIAQLGGKEPVEAPFAESTQPTA